MRQKKIIPWVALASAVFLNVGAAASAQTKYHLQTVYHPGDQFVQDDTMDMTLHVQEKVDGQDDPPATIVQREHDRYTEQVLATAKNELDAIRRIYSLSRRVVTDADLLQRTEVTSLQGKTITVRKRGGQVVATPVRGKLAAADRQDLLKALEPDREFFPDHDLAVGEEWTVDPKRILQFFAGMDQAAIKYQLAEIVTYAGHPCARIHLSVQLSGHTADLPAPTTLTLTGDLYHALDLQQTLSQELSGPITLKGEESANGRVVSFSGEGTMRIKETRQWLKGGGRTASSRSG